MKESKQITYMWVWVAGEGWWGKEWWGWVGRVVGGKSLMKVLLPRGSLLVGYCGGYHAIGSGSRARTSHQNP